MFCIACATHNPATLPRCAVCSTPLGAGTRQAAPPKRWGRSGRLRWVRLLCVAPLVGLLLASGLMIDTYRSERAALATAYARAETSLSNGDFSGAIGAFTEAGVYRDAAPRRARLVSEIAPYHQRYLDGVEALNSGRYQAAIADFVWVLRDLTAYQDAAALLAEARALETAALTQAVDLAEAKRDWLGADAALVQLLALDPDNAAAADRLAELRRLHAPILFTRAGKILTIGPDSDDERLVVDVDKAMLPTWSPDRTRIAFYANVDDLTGNLGLFIVNADGTGLRQLAEHIGLDRWPAWSPDGAKIAYIRLGNFDVDGQRGVTSLRVIDLDSGAEVDLTSGHLGYVVSPSWSPEGTRIAFVSKDIYNRGAAIGRNQFGEVVVADLVSGALTVVTRDRIPFAEYVAWSPASERLLILSAELGSGWYDISITVIHMLDLESDVVTAITTRSQSVGEPYWSPDGQKYAFVEGADIVQIRTVGGAKTWINVPRDVTALPTWSPDGAALLVPANTPANPSVVIHLETGWVEDLPLMFDLSGVFLGPPRWSGTRVAAVDGPATIGGSGLDPDSRDAARKP